MLSAVVMFTKRTTAALFAIAIASSLIVASGFVGSAFAAKKSQRSEDDTYNTMSDGKDKISGPRPNVDNLGVSGLSPQDNSPSSAKDSSGAQDSSGIPSSDLKKLSKCESGAAEDGDLTQSEVTDCYSQVFV
jgi:hypothetical protein